LLRQRLTSPIRLAILALMTLLPPMMVAAFPTMGMAPLGDGYAIALLFAAGMIGQDVSSGVLQLVLARPVRRWEYVLSRWLAAASGATVVALGQVLLTWGILIARGSPPGSQDVALLAAGRVLEIFGATAVIAFFSTLIGGIGDLALYVLLNILGGMLTLVGQLPRWSLAQWLGREISVLISPRIELAQWVAGSPSWLPVLTYLSNLTLCLVLAIVVLNKKELSYAST
jgi:ABC-type transport system involved in multi-copper enzyme maturation permease subunit